MLIIRYFIKLLILTIFAAIVLLMTQVVMEYLPILLDMLLYEAELSEIFFLLKILKY